MARDDALTTAGGSLLALALLPAFWPADASAGAICPETEDVQLTVGQTKDAGEVKVCNDDDTLTITYEATYPFCLLGTDLHVATIPEPPADPDANIPQNRQGIPTPDAFADGDEYDPCAGTDTFEIPLADIGGGVSPDDSVVIAARADLEDEDGKVEEAWGQGTRFVEKRSWAMYFTYTVEEGTCGGEDSKCVFVTSETYNGDLRGLQGADEKCQARAEAAGSLAAPGTYKAWLSDSTASPSTRFTQASVPYTRVDGVTIANNWTDLVDGTLAAPIDRDEAGEFVALTTVWTNTLSNGERATPGEHCFSWTVPAASLNSVVGASDATGTTWTNWFRALCDQHNRLYCFQQ